MPLVVELDPCGFEGPADRQDLERRRLTPASFEVADRCLTNVTLARKTGFSCSVSSGLNLGKLPRFHGHHHHLVGGDDGWVGSLQ